MVARAILNLLKKIAIRALIQNMLKTHLNSLNFFANAKIIAGSGENIFAAKLAELLNITVIKNLGLTPNNTL